MSTEYVVLRLVYPFVDSISFWPTLLSPVIDFGRVSTELSLHEYTDRRVLTCLEL
jgi:hypothetical protein